MNHVNNPEIPQQELGAILTQFKIHLQPRKEAVPKIFERLLQSFSKDEELRRLIPIFKASLSKEVQIDKNDNVVPEIVLYVTGRNNAEKALLKLRECFAADKRRYDAEDLKQKIRAVRIGKERIDTITRTGGLRLKVTRLLEEHG